MTTTTSTPLVRPRNGRWVSGVCAGIANRFGWKASMVRLAFILSMFLPGPQFIIYLILWLVIPSES